MLADTRRVSNWQTH